MDELNTTHYKKLCCCAAGWVTAHKHLFRIRNIQIRDRKAIALLLHCGNLWTGREAVALYICTALSPGARIPRIPAPCRSPALPVRVLGTAEPSTTAGHPSTKHRKNSRNELAELNAQKHFWFLFITKTEFKEIYLPNITLCKPSLIQRCVFHCLQNIEIFTYL